jgi:hypothetical protein
MVGASSEIILFFDSARDSAKRRDVADWPIASFRRAAELGRYRVTADSDNRLTGEVAIRSRTDQNKHATESLWPYDRATNATAVSRFREGRWRWLGCDPGMAAQRPACRLARVRAAHRHRQRRFPAARLRAARRDR